MRPSAGQLRFSFRFWQRGQAITQALHTPAAAAIAGNHRPSRVVKWRKLSIDQQCARKSTTLGPWRPARPRGRLDAGPTISAVRSEGPPRYLTVGWGGHRLVGPARAAGQIRVFRRPPGRTRERETALGARASNPPSAETLESERFERDGNSLILRILGASVGKGQRRISQGASSVVTAG